MDVSSIHERLLELLNRRKNLLQQGKSTERLEKTIQYYQRLLEKYTTASQEQTFELPSQPDVIPMSPSPNYPSLSFSDPFQPPQSNQIKKSPKKKDRGNENDKPSKKSPGSDALSLMRNLPAIGKIIIKDLISPAPRSSDQKTENDKILRRGKNDLKKVKNTRPSGKDKKNEKKEAKVPDKEEDVKIPEVKLTSEEEEVLKELEKDVQYSDDGDDIFTQQEESLRRLVLNDEESYFGERENSSFGEDISTELQELEDEIREEKRKENVSDRVTPDDVQLGRFRINELEDEFKFLSGSLSDVKNTLVKQRISKGDAIVSEKRTSKGDIVREYSSGKRVVQTKKNIKKYFFPDGTKLVKKASGDYKLEYKDKREDLYFKQFNQYQIQFPDGRKIVHFLKAKKSEYTLKDGEIMIFGSGVRSYRDDKRREQLLKNGTKVTTHYKNDSSVCKEIVLQDGRSFIKVLQ